MKKLNLIRLLSLVLLTLYLGACASITNLTGAKTLPEGQSEKVLAATINNLKLKQDDASDTSATGYGFDFMYRYGLTDDDEIGVRLANFATYYMLDYKRALVKGGKFNFSVGPGVGFTKYSIGESSFTRFDLYGNLYGDYVVSDNAAVIFGPKLMYSVTSGGNVTNSSFGMALAGGTKIGSESGLILEAAWGKFFEEGSANNYQFNIGFFF